MSDFERISRNSIYSFLSISFRLVSNVLLFWLIARFYGKDIFGQFSIAQTFAAIFVLFADFGLDMLLTTEIPKDLKRARELFQRYFSIKLFLTIVAFIVMIAIAVSGKFDSQVNQLIIIFSFYAAFTTLSNFLYALFKGFEQLGYETRVAFFVNFFTLILILTLIFLEKDIITISLSFVGMRFLGFIVAIYYAHKLLPDITFRPSFKDVRKILDHVVVFGLFLVFGNLYFQLDTILIAYLLDTESVGIYQAVFKLIVLPLIIPEIFVGSILPALARLYSSEIEKWDKIGFSLYKLLVYISIPISITLFVYPDQIILLIYGVEYIEAVPILRVFSIIVLVRFFAETYGLMLTSSLRQKMRMYVVLGATVFNLVLNLLLIPQIGIVGAVITALLTNLLVAFLFIYITKSFSFIWIKNVLSIKLIIVSALLYSTLFAFGEFGYWIVGILAIIPYLLFIYYKLLSVQEKQYLSLSKLFLVKKIKSKN